MQSVANLLIPVVSLGVSFAVIRFGLDRKVDKSSVFMNWPCHHPAGLCLNGGLLAAGAADPQCGGLSGSDLRLCIDELPAHALHPVHPFPHAEPSGCGGWRFDFRHAAWFYYLFLDVLDLGANGYLLAMACSDALSAIFVFIAGHCHQYFSFKKFNKALWKDMLRLLASP